MRASQLAKKLDIDKSLALFRDPDDEWIFQLIMDRTPEEKERIRATIEAAFPRDTQN